MQINGLDRQENSILGDDQEATRAQLSDPHEHRCSQRFRSILLVTSALVNVSDAFNIACALVDQTLGEIVVLEAASQTRGNQTLADHASWLSQTSNIDWLEIPRPSLGATSIDEVAQKYACDLVILGMENQTSELRMMSGRVAEEVFRRLQCPALVFGPRALKAPFARADGPIVFATSFQERNMSAIGLASKFAHLTGSPLECVHVLPVDMADSNHACQIVPQIMRDALVAGAKQNHVTVRPEQCHILYGRSVSDAVVEFAALRKARFIVLGARQSVSVVSHLPAGRVPSVILFAPCPVLILASPGQRDSH
jgi:nucleotide-binding universal stress UspA family protein